MITDTLWGGLVTMDADAQPLWRVEVSEDGASRSDVFDFVILATGNYSRPAIPDSWQAWR